MASAAFIDTNILLYAASNGVFEPEKTRLARLLLRSRPWAVSMQVVQDFHVSATKKFSTVTHRMSTFRRRPGQSLFRPGACCGGS